MWMDEQLKELKERITGLSDDELLKMVEVDFDDYRKEALDFAKAELISRGITFDEPDTVSFSLQGSVETDASARELPPCAKCGGNTRLGVLLGETEITVLFSDKDEQRFVEVRACVKCGQIHLVVDLETDVDEAPSSRTI